MKIGLKLWSTNDNYIASAKELFSAGVFDFIELYVVPGSFAQYKDVWKSSGIPFTLHAPHTAHGFNLALREKAASNLELFREVAAFADHLAASSIIVHPGIEGELASTLDQLANFKQTLKSETVALLTLENKPYLSLYDTICRGSTVDEVNAILLATGFHFCLDIGHAIKTALYHKQDYLNYLDQFFTLNPSMIHLSDGHLDNCYDQHFSLGSGSFDLPAIMQRIHQKSISTLILETSKSSKENLDDYARDVAVVRDLLNKGVLL